MAPISSFLAFTLLAVHGAIGHPGHNVAEEAAERAEYFKLKPRTIRDCAAHLDRRGLTAGSIARRRDLAASVRMKRGLLDTPLLSRRDFSDYEFSHQYTNGSITLETDENSIFTDNSSCTLQTDVTQGPYYVAGELIRQDVRDSQDGIPLYIDVQVIDTSTCEPVSGVYMDFWHANSTGVYSGVVANGNGDDSDTSNLDSRAMRGIQQTDDNGLVQFITNFPGHYDGRATHIHIMTHTAATTVLGSNNTILGDDDVTHASHVGQLFFDQDLITQVSQISPYSEITATITQNSDDSILAQEADTTDPFVEYVLLGNSLSDGLLAWISVGIDPSKDSEVQAAATYYETGGVANENSMGGGSGGPGGNSTTSGGPSGNSTMSGGPGGNGTMSGSPPDASGTMSGGVPDASGTASGSASGVSPPDSTASASSGSSSSGSGSGSNASSSDSTSSASPSSTSGLVANASTGGAAPSQTYAGTCNQQPGQGHGSGHEGGPGRPSGSGNGSESGYGAGPATMSGSRSGYGHAPMSGSVSVSGIGGAPTPASGSVSGSGRAPAHASASGSGSGYGYTRSFQG